MRGRPEAAAILAELRVDLRAIVAAVPLSADMARLMEFCVEHGPTGGSARDLAAHFGLPQTSLNSRFYRAGVPGPRRLLQAMRLIYIARLAAAGWKSEDVAYLTGYSSHCALARALRRERATGFRGVAALAERELDGFRFWFTRAAWPTHALSGTRPTREAAHAA